MDKECGRQVALEEGATSAAPSLQDQDIDVDLTTSPLGKKMKRKVQKQH